MEIICFRCRTSKQENEFGVDNKSRSGYRATCKECESGKKTIIVEKEKSVKEVFKSKLDNVVMAQSYENTPNVYYIFRSTHEQITINVLPDGRYRSSHLLEDYEIKFIGEKYNFKQK